MCSSPACYWLYRLLPGGEKQIFPHSSSYSLYCRCPDNEIAGLFLLGERRCSRPGRRIRRDHSFCDHISVSDLAVCEYQAYGTVGGKRNWRSFHDRNHSSSLDHCVVLSLLATPGARDAWVAAIGLYNKDDRWLAVIRTLHFNVVAIVGGDRMERFAGDRSDS